MKTVSEHKKHTNKMDTGHGAKTIQRTQTRSAKNSSDENTDTDTVSEHIMKKKKTKKQKTTTLFAKASLLYQFTLHLFFSLSPPLSLFLSRSLSLSNFSPATPTHLLQSIPRSVPTPKLHFLQLVKSNQLKPLKPDSYHKACRAYKC